MDNPLIIFLSVLTGLAIGVVIMVIISKAGLNKDQQKASMLLKDCLLYTSVTEIDFIQILRNDFFLGQVLFQTHTHVDFLYLTFYFFQRGICLALFFGLFLFRLHDEAVSYTHLVNQYCGIDQIGFFEAGETDNEKSDSSMLYHLF